MSDVTITTIPWQAMDVTKKIQNSTMQAKEGSPDHDDKTLHKACAEFESLFISQLLKEMRETIPKSGFMSGGKGEEIYTQMLDSQIARKMALNGGLGLSSLIRFQLEDVKK